MYLGAPGCRTWTIMVEYISATGQAVKSVVIFKGIDIEQ